MAGKGHSKDCSCNICCRKGKTYEQMYGLNKALEQKKLRAISFSGEGNPAKRLDVRKKISEGNKGKNEKLSETRKRLFKEGKIELSGCARLSKFNDFSKGKNNPNWQNGISFEIYPSEFNDELKNEIRKRDNFTCQQCKFKEEQLDRKLDVHHMDYNKMNNNPNNLISLCRVCHMQTNFNREDWNTYFKSILEG